MKHLLKTLIFILIPFISFSQSLGKSGGKTRIAPTTGLKKGTKPRQVLMTRASDSSLVYADLDTITIGSTYSLSPLIVGVDTTGFILNKNGVPQDTVLLCSGGGNTVVDTRLQLSVVNDSLKVEVINVATNVVLSTSYFDDIINKPDLVQSAANDLRLNGTTIVEGTDDPTNAKGSQLIYNTSTLMSSYYRQYLGANGVDRPVFLMFDNGDIWSAANSATTGNNVSSMAWRPTKNGYGAFHVGYFTTANINGFGAFTFTHGHTNTNTSQLGFVSGLKNVNSGDVNYILGGTENVNSATYGGILGGTRNNNSNSVNSLIGGGVENVNTSNNGGIFTGIICENSGNSSTVMGGYHNINELCNYASILTGLDNKNKSNGSYIGTGNNNLNDIVGAGNESFSFIGTGLQCLTQATAYYAAIITGLQCSVTSQYGVNLNGKYNTTNSLSQISGGSGNVPFTGQSPAAWVSTDLLEAIGNTESLVDKSNCRTTLKNGKTQINTDNIAKTQAMVTPQASLHVVSSTEGVILTPMTEAQVNTYIATLNLTTDITGVGGNPNYSKRITVECTDCTSLDGSTLGVTLKIYPNAASTAWIAKKLW